MTEQELKNYILKLCKSKTPIPKPKGQTILSVGDKLGQNQFQYTFGIGRKKSVTFATLFRCYEKLTADGKFTRRWFATEFETEHASSPCNFTTIGGIFVKLKIAEYCGNGLYTLVKKSTNPDAERRRMLFS